MPIYNVEGLRNNLRAALTQAEAGDVVKVQRYDKEFSIVLSNQVRASPEIAKRIKQSIGQKGVFVPKVVFKEDLIGATPQAQMQFCKNGHPIPEGRERCLGKGCKYS